MKKSVIEAMKQARQHSQDHPGVTVRVMDKARKHAVVTASDWVYRERILEDWTDVAMFKDGKMLRGPENLTCDCCTDKGHCPEYKSGEVCVNDRRRSYAKQ